MQRIIFHVDLDAFFVAVERTLDHRLVGKPVIVGGMASDRGVVTSASYEARSYGVRSAMPISLARRLCGQAIFLPNRHKIYSQVSSEFMNLLHDFSPLVQPVSIDEAYVDMTGTKQLWGTPKVAALKIKKYILRKLQLPSSIGIAESKLIAKIASNKAKPNGLLEINPGQSAAFLAPLSLRMLPGLGPNTEKTIKQLGIKTLGELAKYSEGPLRRTLGVTNAKSLQLRASGVDTSAVNNRTMPKSISAESTFEKDTGNNEYLQKQLRQLTDQIGTRIRNLKLHGSTVVLKLRYHDFETITRQTSLPKPSDGDDAIYTTAKHLLETVQMTNSRPVRLIGVAINGLQLPSQQLQMLEDVDIKDSNISQTVDGIRRRFGETSIRRGSTINFGST